MTKTTTTKEDVDAELTALAKQYRADLVALIKLLDAAAVIDARLVEHESAAIALCGGRDAAHGRGIGGLAFQPLLDNSSGSGRYVTWRKYVGDALRLTP